MVPSSHMVKEGSPGEEAFKGATGQAKEAATAARGEEFRQRESRNTTLQQDPPPSLGTQDQARKGGSPYVGCAQRARPGRWPTEAWQAVPMPSPVPSNGLPAKRGRWGPALRACEASWTQKTESQADPTREDFMIGRAREQTSVKPGWMQRRRACR